MASPLAGTGLHWADITALLLYFVTITLLGVGMARRVHSMADFVMPRKFGKVMMVLFGFGSGTHSDQAVSVAAKSYTAGVSGIWYQWLWLFCTPFYWTIAPVMRRFRALTTADVFEARYDKSTAKLFAFVGLIQYTVNIGAMLIGASSVIEACTGDRVPTEIAIPVMTILFVVYGVAGGLSAAIVTDLIQGALTIFFSFLLLPYVLAAVGGIAGLHAYADQHGISSMMAITAPEEISVFYVIVLAINALVGIVAQPHTMANCAAGKTELDGQVGWMCGNLLKRICTIAWCLTGVAGVAFLAQLGMHDAEPKKVFGLVAYEILPNIMHGMLGLFIAGLIASVMSSCDAFMVTTSGLFTENVYKPTFPGRSVRHYLWVARFSTIGVVIAGVLFAYAVDDPVAALEIFWKISPMLGVAFWMGLFWRRATTAGAWASTIVGFATWWLTTTDTFIDLARQLPYSDPLRFIYQDAIYLPWQMIFYLSSAFTSGVVVSLLTRPPNQTKLENFYALVRTPVADDEPEVESPCTLPAGVSAAPIRKLIPWRQFEIYRPSFRLIAGFVAGWAAVIVLAGLFMWIVRRPIG